MSWWLNPGSDIEVSTATSVFMCAASVIVPGGNQSKLTALPTVCVG